MRDWSLPDTSNERLLELFFQVKQRHIPTLYLEKMLTSQQEDQQHLMSVAPCEALSVYLTINGSAQSMVALISRLSNVFSVIFFSAT